MLYRVFYIFCVLSISSFASTKLCSTLFNSVFANKSEKIEISDIVKIYKEIFHINAPNLTSKEIEQISQHPFELQSDISHLYPGLKDALEELKTIVEQTTLDNQGVERELSKALLETSKQNSKTNQAIIKIQKDVTISPVINTVLPYSDVSWDPEAALLTASTHFEINSLFASDRLGNSKAFKLNIGKILAHQPISQGRVLLLSEKGLHEISLLDSDKKLITTATLKKLFSLPEKFKKTLSNSVPIRILPSENQKKWICHNGRYVLVTKDGSSPIVLPAGDPTDLVVSLDSTALPILAKKIQNFSGKFAFTQYDEKLTGQQVLISPKGIHKTYKDFRTHGVFATTEPSTIRGVYSKLKTVPAYRPVFLEFNLNDKKGSRLHLTGPLSEDSMNKMRAPFSRPVQTKSPHLFVVSYGGGSGKFKYFVIDLIKKESYEIPLEDMIKNSREYQAMSSQVGSRDVDYEVQANSNLVALKPMFFDGETNFYSAIDFSELLK